MTHPGDDKIPSPSRRLWLGLCVILSIFIVFAIYTAREVRWLENFQVNVVQRNRKASLQLLRLQNDAYLLAISLRDMAFGATRYPINEWKPEFTRLRRDMDDAARLEARFARDNPAASQEHLQLHAALEDFSRSADRVFAIAQQGQISRARHRIRTELDNKRAVITAIVARLLVMNDQAQADAARKISAVYKDVKTNLMLITGLLLLLALATGLYTFQANRKTFEKLRRLAEQLQGQSDQLQKLSWKLIDVQEETLRQVARDLHDEFGQILTAIGVMLNRSGRKASFADPALLQDFEAVKNIVEETLQKVRDQSQIFRPAILDDFGIEETIEWFTRQFSKQSGIQVHFRSSVAEDTFAPEEAIHLYRIVQESLNNVARHARASEAWVIMRQDGRELTLKISDNGVGLETTPRAGRSPAEGMGLMGMRERSEHLNGTMTVGAAPKGGTVITVRVPIPSRPEQRPAAKET